MNQILSVEMPRDNNKKTKRISSGGKKASIKSVVIFFCIILLIFGIVMIGLGVMSKLNEAPQEQVEESSKPRIDISQNASDQLEIEISSESEISKIEYRWNNEEMKEETGNGTGKQTLSVDIPSGQNTFKIKVTDIQGITSEYENIYEGNNYVTPNVNLKFDEITNSLKIVCEEQKNISYISYFYDSEQEQRKDINNTIAEIDIPIKQGEHDLTVKVEYEDGTLTKPISKKVYFPVVEKVALSEDGGSFILKASDVRKIRKVKMNFNGVETEEEVNSENFEKVLQLKDGENRLILTVYSNYGIDENNPNGVSITTRTRWEKK